MRARPRISSGETPRSTSSFKAASQLGLRIPDCERLFLTNEDIANMLALHGFETVDKVMDLVIPKEVLPGVARLANWAVSKTPVLHLAGSTQLIVARKIPECCEPNVDAA